MTRTLTRICLNCQIDCVVIYSVDLTFVAESLLISLIFCKYIYASLYKLLVNLLVGPELELVFVEYPWETDKNASVSVTRKYSHGLTCEYLRVARTRVML